MVEELKIAIKVDDDSVEQSLLKQFANAQKMADKVVLDFKNVNFDDKEIEAKFKALQKKAGQNPIDLSISKDSIQMLSQISDKLGDIFKIAHGKSIIDSSSTNADIGKIENKLNELTKKYEDLQKKASGGISGKEVNLVDNDEFKKLSQEVSELKGQFDDLKTHMSLLDDYTVPTDRFFELQTQVEATSVKVSNLVDEMTRLSNVQKNIGAETNISLGDSETPKKDKYAKRSKISEEDFLNYSPTKVNKKLSNSGYTILGETVNTELVNGLVKVSAKIKDADGAWKSFSAKVDADGNIFEQRFRTITNGVDKLETALENFGRETSPALTYQETLDKAQKIKNSLNLGDEYSIKVDSSEFVTITKKLTDIENAGTSVTQTFKSAQDAIDNFGKAASNSAEKTSVALKSVKNKDQMKDAIQADNSSVANASTSAIKEENNALEQTAQSAENAAEGKKKFAKANKEVKDSADASVGSVKDENNAFDQNEWDKNVQAIQDYMDAVTKLNNLKAKDKGTDKNKNQIELQTQKVEELKQAAYDARANLTSMFNPHNVDIDTWIKWVNAMKQFYQASEGSAESVAKLEDALRSVNESQKKYMSSVVSKQQNYLGDYHTFMDREDYLPTNNFREKFSAYESEFNKLQYLADQLSKQDFITQDQLNDFEILKKHCEELRKALTNMNASDKGAWAVDVQKEIDKINSDLMKNSNYSEEAKQKLRGFIELLKAGNISDTTLKEIHNEFLKITNAEKLAGREGKNFFDILKNSRLHQMAAQMAGMFSVYDVINAGKQGVQIIRELDEAMTEVRKVSEATEFQYKSFQKTISATAKEIASTNKELLNSSADFLRLGYSLDQAKNLAENATLFVNVGDGVDINEATEDMITAMKAFDIKAEESIKIVDSYNQTGNLFALSASDIGEAMKRSASALETGNNSFEESIALITAMNEIVQNSENTGNTLKVLSLRLRGAKAELENMSEDTDGLCESTSKLREQIQSLTGVDIMIDENNFKSTAEIIKELGAVWDNLSDTSQAATLELIAGKSRSNNVAALLKNYKQIDEVLAKLENAEGSALRENNAIVDSINGRIKILSASMEEFWQVLINDSVIKNAISALTTLVEGATEFVDTVGVFPTLLTSIGGYLSFKNVGRDKMYSLT